MTGPLGRSSLPSSAGAMRFLYPRSRSSPRNWSTRLRRCVRISTPPVREASTNPSAATVLPAPVACSNQNRLAAFGSSGCSPSCSSSCGPLELPPPRPSRPAAPRPRRGRAPPRARRRRPLSSSSSSSSSVGRPREVLVLVLVLLVAPRRRPRRRPRRARAARRPRARPPRPLRRGSRRRRARRRRRRHPCRCAAPRRAARSACRRARRPGARRASSRRRASAPPRRGRARGPSSSENSRRHAVDGILAALGDLGESEVERGAPRRARSEREGGFLPGVDEGLARERLGASDVGIAGNGHSGHCGGFSHRGSVRQREESLAASRRLEAWTVRRYGAARPPVRHQGRYQAWRTASCGGVVKPAMSEIRVDPLSGLRTIIAPGRASAAPTRGTRSPTATSR